MSDSVALSNKDKELKKLHSARLLKTLLPIIGLFLVFLLFNYLTDGRMLACLPLTLSKVYVIMIASIIVWFLGYYPNHNDYATVAEQQEHSYIGQIGKVIEPVIEPLGFDWKLGVGLLSGVGAKELVVSTLGVLYTNQEELESVNLSDRIPITPIVALGYMLFSLIYFPCIATLAAIKQESGSWKWAFFTAFYTTALAWVVAFIVKCLGVLL